MERLTILVGRLYKSVAPTKYFFKVKLVGRFMALVGVISRPVESPISRQILYIFQFGDIGGQDFLQLVGITGIGCLV